MPKKTINQRSTATIVQTPATLIKPRYIEQSSHDKSPKAPDPTSTDYRTISEKRIYGQFYFNAKELNSLREVTVSGVKLIWDDQNGDLALLNLINKKKMGRIMIVADSVHINMPLVFPQSEVVICARQLVFGTRGSIDITPDSNNTVPEKGKIPVGSGKFRGIDGIDGSNAGSIILSVNTLCIPEEDESKQPVRIIARGADGQPGGDGDWVDPTLGAAPIDPNTKKAISTNRITYKIFRDALFKTLFCTTPFAIPVTLEFADATAGQVGKLFGDSTMEAFVENIYKSAFKDHYVLHIDANVNLHPVFYIRKWRFTRGEKIKPLDGSDAYPSGIPGGGGDGGTVTFLGKLVYYSKNPEVEELSVPKSAKPCKIPFEAIVDVSGGKAGISKWVDGQPPFLREPKASFGEVTVSLDGGICKPYTSQNVSPKKGKPAPAPIADKGSKGFVNENRDEPTPFIHEYNTEAILSYAKDACMAHNREMAGRVVEVYIDAIENVREHTTPKLEALRADLYTLKQQLNSDVDIYGNQRGWVPYLSVVANKDIFDATAKIAFDTMYLCTKMKDHYETMADNFNCLNATRKLSEQSLISAQEKLEKAQNENQDLRDRFNDINSQIGKYQSELASLNNEIAQWAELDEKNKAVYAGISKTVGGCVQLLGAGIQCIPVGQPATGIIGGVIQFSGKTGGDIVSSLIEGGNLFDTTGQLTEQATQFIEQNKADISNEVVNNSFKAIEKDLKEAKNKYTNIARQTQNLSKDKDLLKALMMLPIRKLPDEVTKEEFEKFKNMRKKLCKLNSGVQDVEMEDISFEEMKKIEKHAEPLEGYLNYENYKSAIDKLRQNSKQANKLDDLIGTLSKEKQQKIKSVQTVLGGLAEMKGGIQQGLQGIQKMTVRREELEPKIQAHIEKLEGTTYAERFKNLSVEIAALINTKEEFIRQFERCQIAINSATSTIASSMAQLDVIDDRTLGISGILDHSVYSGLVSLDKEARAMLMEQLYYFAKSYEYRTLKKIDPDFYKLDKYIKKLEVFLKDDKNKEDTWDEKIGLKEDQFMQIYKLLTARLSEFVKPLIKDLQTGQQLRKAPFPIPARQLMDEHTFQKLNKPGPDGNYDPVVFNLVKCGFGESTTRKHRILSLNLKEVVMADPEKAKQKQSTFSMEFEHSGVSILFDGKEHYLFRSQTDDEKISWKFSCAVNRDGVCVIEPYERETRDIELIRKLLNDLCDSQKDVDQLSAPYRPGTFSDITLIRRKMGIIKERAEIADFVIEVVREGIM